MNTTINLDQKIVDYIDYLDVNETTGEELVEYVKSFSEKVPKVVDTFHAMLMPVYDLLQPFVSLFQNFADEFCKKDVTIKNFMKAVTKHGVEVIELLNEMENKNIDDLKKDSIDLSGSLNAFWKATKFDIKECTFENYSDFKNYTESTLKYKYTTLPTMLLKSLKGPIFAKSDIIEMLLDINKNNAHNSLDKMSLLVEKIGNLIFIKNPFVNMKRLILPISLPLASAQHYPNELYSQIFKNDLIIVNAYIYSLMSHLIDGEVSDVSSIAQTVRNVESPMKSMINAYQRYMHDLDVIEGNLKKKLYIIIGASFLSVVLISIIGIVIYCIMKKQRVRHAQIDNQELTSQSGTLFQTF